MPLHPPNERTRERILSLGAAGVGKSYDWLSIASLSAKTKSDARFYVIDTDVSLDRLLTTEFVDVDVSGVVEGFDVEDWTELTQAINKITEHMRRQDWLIVDLLSPSWEFVQQFYTESVFKQSIDEYFLQARIQMESSRKKDADTLEGWRDWSYINKLYKQGVQNKILRCPGNVYATAEVKALSRERASKEDMITFGPHGVTPVGQKRTPYIFQSVLLKTQPRIGEFAITSVKDRGRPVLQNAPVSKFGFGLQYLVAVGGWGLA